MSIQSEIIRINNNISSAYSAIDAKGGTLPQTQNSANLANSIQSISGGSEYTAGAGIEINDGVIDNVNDYSALLNLYMSVLYNKDLREGATSAGAYSNTQYSLSYPTLEEYLTMLSRKKVVVLTDGSTLTVPLSSIVKIINNKDNRIMYGTANANSSISGIPSASNSVSGDTTATINVQCPSVSFIIGDKFLVLNGSLLYVKRAFNYSLQIPFNTKKYTWTTKTTVNEVLDELATTRIADTLVSTETTPTVNNTINWQYG